MTVTPLTSPFDFHLTPKINSLMQALGFKANPPLETSLVFCDVDATCCILIDLGICSRRDLAYVDYTQIQNDRMVAYPKLLRFALEEESEFSQFKKLLKLFTANGDLPDTSMRRFGQVREKNCPDPTHPEAEFERCFQIAFGESALYALQREYPFTDFAGVTRYVDYVLNTQHGKIAIELNGEKFHHPASIGPSRYRSQLFKQNSLVMSGLKVFRWSLRGMQDNETFIDEMRKFFGETDVFCRTPHYLASRKLETFRLMEHQEDALEQLDTGRVQGKNAFLVVLPTGTGKTEILMEDFKRIKLHKPMITGLILTPTRELRTQTLKKLQARLPKWQHGETQISQEVNQGFMVQTYQHMIRNFEQYQAGDFGYIAVDEAHHAVAPGLRRVLEHFSPETLIGLTATDQRFDQKNLEEVFGSYETSLTLQEAIAQGILPPIRAFRLETNIDLSEVRYNGIDYVQKDLQKTLIVPSRDQVIVDVIERYFGTGRLEKQGIVFCVSVRHAESLADLLRNRGIPAKAVSGQDRAGSANAIEAYHHGRTRILCACDLLTEGWDAPQTSILVMARPTMSKVLYMQQLGRGTRAFPGKEALYVVDVVDRYGPMNAPWSVHAVFGLGRYEPWATLMSVANQKGLTSEHEILLSWLYEQERRITEINIFTFQRQYEDYLNEEQLARELFVSTGTVKSWIRRKEIEVDVEVPFGKGLLRYFAPSRVPEIRQLKNLRVHDESTQYEDFIEFLKERDYTFSYKITFLLSLFTLTNRRGEAALDTLTEIYTGFYEDRLRQGIPADRPNCPYNKAIILADRDSMTRSILQNPFEKFERKRFLHHCRDLKYIAFSSSLWSRMRDSSGDIERILRQITEDLAKYYEPLQGLGDTSFLVSTYPGIRGFLKLTDTATVPSTEHLPLVCPTPTNKYKTCVPLYSLRVAAGAFIEGDPPEPEHWIDVAAVSRRRKLHSGMFVTQVVGKSMEPVIPDGSYCLFARPVEGTRQGRILLVQKRGISDPDTGGSYTIKRYRSRKIFLEDEQWEHEQIELCPENPEYPVLNIRDVDSNELQVIAEFIEVLRNVK